MVTVTGVNYTISSINSCDELDNYDVGDLLFTDLAIDATPLSEALIAQGCDNTGALVTIDEGLGLVTVQVYNTCCCLGEAFGSTGLESWSASFVEIACPETENIELRSDGGFELRSDGGLEIRS